MDVGKKIKEVLTEKRISQAELGRLIGKERANINSLLKSNNMGVQTLLQISEAIDVPISVFFEEETNSYEVKEPIAVYETNPIFIEKRLSFLEQKYTELEKKISKIK